MNSRELNMLRLLRRVRDCCIFEDDDGSMGVTEDPHLPAELFDQICGQINTAEAKEKGRT